MGALARAAVGACRSRRAGNRAVPCLPRVRAHSHHRRAAPQHRASPAPHLGPPMSGDAERQMKDWWRTEIIDMRPGVIRFSAYAIEELIGRISLAQMIWLMTRGELPSRAQGELLDAALTAGIDHGPQAPSIAIARMAATCGVDLNNAIASALNVLGDVHGGAGEQAVELFEAIAARLARGEAESAAVEAALAEFSARRGKFIPGYGHRFHPVDPRAPRLLELVDAAARAGVVDGRFARIARAVEKGLAAR